MTKIRRNYDLQPRLGRPIRVSRRNKPFVPSQDPEITQQTSPSHVEVSKRVQGFPINKGKNAQDQISNSTQEPEESRESVPPKISAQPIKEAKRSIVLLFNLEQELRKIKVHDPLLELAQSSPYQPLI